MTVHCVVDADAIVEQLVIQCWLFERRAGDIDGTRLKAERTLERLLSRGLPHAEGPQGPRFDPYAAANFIKCRAGELEDEAWHAWQATARRNAESLPAAPHRYRLRLRREWHGYTLNPARPVVLRIPLPLRGAQRGPATVRLVEPAGAQVDIRELPGRVELRVDPARIAGPLVAEVAIEFEAGESRDALTPSSAPGEPVPAAEQLWLRDKEGLIAMSPPVVALAARLAAGRTDARGFVHAAWHWLISELRFGDWHRGDLDMADPLGALMQSRLSDCILGSSMLAALCRARGIPARIVSGYLLHPANVGPHSWAEVRIAPDTWIPVDFGAWCYSAGNANDPQWGSFFLGRSDARFLAEVAPREFTGWGSAPPPERWYRLERLVGQGIEHTLHALPGNSLFRRDLLDLQVIGPTGAGEPNTLTGGS
jgi:hypothetical protein